MTLMSLVIQLHHRYSPSSSEVVLRTERMNKERLQLYEIYSRRQPNYRDPRYNMAQSCLDFYAYPKQEIMVRFDLEF